MRLAGRTREEFEGPGLLPGPFLSGFHEYTEYVDYLRESMGFDLRDVSWSAIATNPPSQFEIVGGSLGSGPTQASLGLCADCEPPSIETHLGTEYYSWGGDLELKVTRSLKPPVFDRLGRGGRIAVVDGLALRALETSAMRAMIETKRDASRSLIEYRPFGILADALDDWAVYVAFMSNQPVALADVVEQLPGAQQRDRDRIQEELTPGLLEPYVAFATRVGRDEQGAFWVLALYHDTGQSAEQNKPRLREQLLNGKSILTNTTFGEIFDIQQLDTEVRDNVLIARVRGDLRGSRWLAWYFGKDILLMHR